MLFGKGVKEKSVKKIGYALSIFGLIVILMDIVYLIRGEYSLSSYFWLGTYIVTTAVFFITTKLNRWIYLQVIFIWIWSLISLYTSYPSSDGILMTTVALVIAYKYHLLKTKLKIKLISIIVSFLIIHILKVIFDGEISLSKTIKLATFHLVYIGIIIYIFQDELKVFRKREKKLKSKLSKAKGRIVVNKKYIDPTKANLSKAELNLLNTLCLYKESNTELASRLNKSVNTVKGQMTRIMSKIGAETRYQLIELCQNYFIENDKSL